MAFSYGFYNSSNGDRKYNATQFGSIFDGVIEDGVFATIGDKFAVTPRQSGLGVYVGTGRAWWNHTWNLNDSEYSITLTPSNLVLPRIDAIVFEIDEQNRTNRLTYVTGTPSSSPQKPSLTDNADVHQHAIAYVTVAAGASKISQSDIEYCVGTETCPYVTAPLEKVSIDELVAQWQDQFNTWFENLQDNLNSNTETNLYNRTSNLCPILVKATFTLEGWRSTASYGSKYTQTANVSKVYSGGGYLSYNSKLIGPATCDQVSNGDTRETMAEALQIINSGYMSSFSGSSMTVYVSELPPCDITCYWIAQADPNA